MKPSALHYAQAFGHETTDKRLDILQRIGEVGSISEAARGAQVSYKAAWQALETLSNLAGAPLVEKAVGGSGGGGARLTPAGVQLLEASALLRQARSQVIATLEKGSGASFNACALIGLGLRTSMRNQLPCQIESITHKGNAARVLLELPNGATLVSKITAESAQLLGLRTGLNAVALCKATAVRIGATLESAQGLNLLRAEVSSAPASAQDTETSLRLSADLHLIGFCVDVQGLSPGQEAVALVDESAIVIAVTD
jgi:molybdate transport system regulatory protein